LLPRKFLEPKGGDNQPHYAAMQRATKTKLEEKEEKKKEWEAKCNNMVDEFEADESRTELHFPPSLSPDDRKVVHHIAVLRNLTSVTEGEARLRHVFLTKKLPTYPIPFESLSSDLR